MAFYSNPEEMYKARAKRSKKDGDMHWAKAKNGEGEYHYGKAKKCYESAKYYENIAKQVKGKTFGKKQKSCENSDHKK